MGQKKRTYVYIYIIRHCKLTELSHLSKRDAVQPSALTPNLQLASKVPRANVKGPMETERARVHTKKNKAASCKLCMACPARLLGHDWASSNWEHRNSFTACTGWLPIENTCALDFQGKPPLRSEQHQGPSGQFTQRRSQTPGLPASSASRHRTAACKGYSL